MIILGLHRDPWHDTGAAMIRDDGDGPRFVNLAEERCNREKDSREFPDRSIAACMNELGVRSFDEIDLIVLDYIVHRDWRNDYHKKRGRSDTFLNNFDPGKIHVINHHLAHAYTVFFSSPFRKSAILVVDGRGSDKETQSLFCATDNHFELLDSTTTIGIGLLYSAVTQKIGFKLLQEGKTMGLAPYGANAKESILTFPRLFDGIVTDYSSVCIEDSYDMTLSHRPLSTFEDKAICAYEVQEECEAAMLHLAEYAKKKTQEDYLCISGGVGLNSVANYKLLQSGLFNDIFINPAASDTGIPLGCALYGYHTILRQPKRYKHISPYLGPTYSESQIKKAVSSFSGYTATSDHALDKAVDYLLANKIIGCFQDRSEMGPRALGNRSILMSPLVAENKDILNARVKHREAFRPFAPAVLAEHTEEYFVFDRENPYMLMVADIHPDKQKIIPAVTHVDGTGRLQTVSKQYNESFYTIVNRWYERSRVPILLNTSFNVAGEPIVETPEDAIRCFLSTEIDALYIGDWFLSKT